MRICAQVGAFFLGDAQKKEDVIAFNRRGGGQRPERRDEPRINRRIRVREVRVIADDGTQLGIIPTDEARRRAEELGLDLVEVQPTARPPVCKIMDFGKYKYEQKRNAARAKKNQKTMEVKEVKFRPKTDTHDFNVKVNRLRRFIDEGNKSKVTIMFRGREIVHPEIGRDILKRVAEQISDIAQVESHARMEGKQMFMVVAPLRNKGNSPKPQQQQQRGAPQGRPPQQRGGRSAPTVERVSQTPPPKKAAE